MKPEEFLKEHYPLLLLGMPEHYCKMWHKAMQEFADLQKQSTNTAFAEWVSFNDWEFKPETKLWNGYGVQGQFTSDELYSRYFKRNTTITKKSNRMKNTRHPKVCSCCFERPPWNDRTTWCLKCLKNNGKLTK